MIANGGKLVTPHVADDVELTGREGPADARPAAFRRRVAAADRRRPDRADVRAARARRGDALAARHLVRRLRLLPLRHRRQDGKRREADHAPRLPDAAEPDAVVVVRLRPVHGAVDRRLCRDRERRPRRHGRCACRAEGVRAVLPHDGHDHEPRRPTDVDRSRQPPREEACAPGARSRRSVSPTACSGSTGSCSPRTRPSSSTASGRSTASRCTTPAAPP